MESKLLMALFVRSFKRVKKCFAPFSYFLMTKNTNFQELFVLKAVLPPKHWARNLSLKNVFLNFYLIVRYQKANILINLEY